MRVLARNRLLRWRACAGAYAACMIELLPFVLLVFYLVPFGVAAARGHDAAVGILVANLLVGWTGVGWLAVMAWAALGEAQIASSRR